MNNSTRFFNGTRDGSPYHARVTETSAWIYEIDVVIFDRESGEPHYSFIRSVENKTIGSKHDMVRAVLRNPDDF